MKRPSLGIVVVLLAAVAVLYGLNRLTSRAEQSEQLPVPQEASASEQKPEHVPAVALGSGKGNTLGNPDAKVRVVAVVPLGVECHMQTIQILQEIAKADPKRVRVEIYDMNSSKGQQELASHGVHCASVFVNGKNQWKIKQDGKERTVICMRKPNDPMSTYNSTDLIEVVHQEMARQYGKGFEPAVLQRLRVRGQQIVSGVAATPLLSEPTKGKPKVVVEVLTPSRQASIYTFFADAIEQLQALKKQYGDALSVRVYSLATREGQSRLQALRLTGPAIVINGKTVHELSEPGKGKRKVVTAFASGSYISLTDVKKVIVALLRQ